MKVKNGSCIRHLSFKTLMAARKRNIIAVLAIALTALLFTSLFTIVMSINETNQNYQFRSVGGYAHGAFKDVDEDQIAVLSAHPDVKAVGVRTVLGLATQGAFEKDYAEVSYMDDNNAKWSFSQPTVGRTPKSGNEITMDTKALELLGVKPELGAQVKVTYTLADKEQMGWDITDTFTLVGWWDYDELLSVHFLNVSKEYAQKIEKKAVAGGLKPFRTDLSVMLRSSLNIENDLTRIGEDCGYSIGEEAGQLRIGVNWGYTATQVWDTLGVGGILAMLAVLILVAFTGYLVIYNIFQISVAGDIRYYGLLKTIGVTPKQLRRLIRQQALLLSALGIPVGLLLGYGVGAAAVPITMSTSMRQKADYIKMYEYIIPKVLKAEDPQAFYWPASPSSGGSFDDPQDPTRGDVHYWMVWHGLLPFTDYRNHQFRYVSEFGFQSFPCMETIESFTAPEDRNVFSYVMEKHQRNASANGRILFYLSQMYLYPRSLELLVYASQLLQAQAMQYGVEHWRRHRGCCMGAVVWQLNDCWPVASWASIDYFGRWKALHYYEKRFFAPVLISCHEEGILSQNTNVNAEPFGLKKSAHLNVSNETMQKFRGKAKWSLRRPDASVIEEGSFDVTVPALSAVWLPEQDFSNYGTYDTYYSYQLLDEAGNGVGEGSVLFCAPKHFRFADPELNAFVKDDDIIVTAKGYARSVEIQAGADVVLSDNYFDMDGGVKAVKILRGSVDSVSVRSVWDIR